MMRFRQTLCQLALTACAALGADGQAVKSLTYFDKLALPLNQENGAFAVRLPMKCGPDGTIYLRFAGTSVDPSITIIRDGKIASIALTQILEFSESGILDFAP